MYLSSLVSNASSVGPRTVTAMGKAQLAPPGARAVGVLPVVCAHGVVIRTVHDRRSQMRHMPAHDFGPLMGNIVADAHSAMWPKRMAIAMMALSRDVYTWLSSVIAIQFNDFTAAHLIHFLFHICNIVWAPPGHN